MSQSAIITVPATLQPTLSTVVPNNGTQGSTVAVTLSGTNFVVGATTVNISGTGVTVNFVVVANTTSLTASFALSPSATLGARTVTVTTVAGTSVGQTFTVNLPAPSPPTLASVVPTSGTQGTTVPVTLTGTGFVIGATTVNITGAGVTINTVVVSSATSLTANFVIDLAASTGVRFVTVTTANGTSSSVNFSVNIATGPPPPGVISRANITYVGCFGLFSGTDSTTLQFSEGGATGRVRPSDGKIVFFVTRGPSESGEAFPVYEIEDPGTYSNTSYTTAPRSANYPTAKHIGSIRGPVYSSAFHMKSWFTETAGGHTAGDDRPPSGGGWNLGALFWNEDTQLLYWTYFDAYNTSQYPDWGLGATSLDSFDAGTSLYTFTSYGPWRIRCTSGDGVYHYGPWRGLYLGRHPTTGKMLCGSTVQSGNSGSPFGFDLFGGADWPIATTPSGYGNPDIVMPDCYLEHYYIGGTVATNGSFTPPLRSYRRRQNAYIPENEGVPNLCIDPSLNGGVGSWTQSDTGGLVCWLELTNTRGVIFAGSLVGAVSQDPNNRDAGHEWYQTGGSNCRHGFQPYLSTQGPVSTHSYPAIAIYDPADLEAVKNTSLDYTPEPVDEIDVDQEYPTCKTADMYQPGRKGMGFVYWDSSRNYLFMLSLKSDDFYPPGGVVGALMHVFHIADVP